MLLPSRARLHRRLSALDSSLLLPSDASVEAEEKNKIEVYFFLDASGSCWSLKDRFFRAALSLPNDRFSVRAFTFDTETYEVDLKKQKVRGGGGTEFDIIESRIQHIMRQEKKQYPLAVFIITDGYGSSVHPEKPNRWYWFLSDNYRSYIPKESNVFMLRDFE